MRRITSFVEGQWLRGTGPHTVVRDKYTDEPIAELVASTSEDVDAAVTSALRAFEGRRIPIADRVTILKRVASGIAARAKELAGAITDEAGATISEAAKEVERAVITLELTAEEATRLSSETVPLEGSGGTSKFAYLVRHPLGVVCAITAFNSPLNTPLHKIAPALAAGNSVVIKPPTSTPICCAILCDIFTECGLPPGWLNLVTGRGATVGEQLLTDPRIAFYHFTGSTEVGRRVAAQCGLRQSSLELGSIAATIVCADADISAAIKDITRAGYAKAGQVCTSTQLVLAETSACEAVRDGLVTAVRALTYGNPKLEATKVGPLIAVDEAKRVCTWMDEAVGAGADRLVGGSRDGAVVAPALFANVPDDARLIRREVFGPAVSLVEVPSLVEAVAHYNSSPYGLSVGVFTGDIGRAFHAVHNLRSGTIHINAASSSRLDAMPFGGVKESGRGKEGPKYAMEEMTERRLVVWHGV
jgi:succinate-semialdehyde dehydrogenase/glutarate-semialdehyde dehydrogenase